MNSNRLQASHNPARIAGAGVLIVGALVLVWFFGPTLVQAFRGPRTITEEELLSMKEPGWWGNYVRFTPARPAQDTGWVYGKKGNEGTKYLLLPVRDRVLFCSVRVTATPTDYVGSLGYIEEKEKEIATSKSGPGKPLPFMLQGVRSIWFDTVFALVGIVAGLGIAGWQLAQVAMTVWATGKPRRRRPREEDEE